MKCPYCQREINIGALLGSVSTPRKAAACRRNAKLGGWPKGKKRGHEKRQRQNAGAVPRRGSDVGTSPLLGKE